MPNYGGFNPQETALYRGRRNRQSFSIREQDTGPDYSLTDQATLLYQAIQISDPKLKKAFTPEVAERILASRRAASTGKKRR